MTDSKQHPRQSLFDYLSDLKVIDQKKLEQVWENSDHDLSHFELNLIENQLITENELGKLVASYYDVPFVDLKQVGITRQTINAIPELVAKKQQVVVFKLDTSGFHVATSTPDNQILIDMLAKKFGANVRTYFALPTDIARALSIYAKDAGVAFADILKQNVTQAKNAPTQEAPIIELVDAILAYAFSNHASDIHIEPEEKYTALRFRIDGVLHDVYDLPSEITAQIITRIKVMAKLRTDEHQTPQDGKISIKMDDAQEDLRVSIVPVTKGEKVVMRLLTNQDRKLSLTDLGMSDANRQKVEDGFHKPHGLLLATGPTGSGKTTSMYAVLKQLNTRSVNIMSIEDPVEYDIEGVHQIQVNQKTGVTFATGLRSIVRQDPDIILVGEIRDSETAQIAINSAMTGHLVLSTMHTNDAATTIPRLLDMGVEPFLIASSINAIIGQRLVRSVCLNCRTSSELPTADLAKQFNSALITEHFGAKDNIRVYQGKGCSACHDSGYSGRIGIFEVLIVSEEIRSAIMKKATADEIQDIAIKEGMKTLLDDGLDKIKQGITTIEEVLRVTKL